MAQKLLIVDDDADLRKTVFWLLRTSFEVLQAADGREALRCVEREHPCLMLLDVSMPEMDGLSVLQAVLAADPELRVIMLTGEQEIKVAERALEFGAAAYITKPFDAAYLLEEVRRQLGAGAGRRAEPPPWRVVS